MSKSQAIANNGTSPCATTWPAGCEDLWLEWMEHLFVSPFFLKKNTQMRSKNIEIYMDTIHKFKHLTCTQILLKIWRHEHDFWGTEHVWPSWNDAARLSLWGRFGLHAEHHWRPASLQLGRSRYAQRGHWKISATFLWKTWKHGIIHVIILHI